jgi:hypothetical protein
MIKGRKTISQSTTMTVSTPIISYSLSEEECVRIGGHCYEVENQVYTTNPPTFKRICKHCGKTQWGHEQESIAWDD